MKNNYGLFNSRLCIVIKAKNELANAKRNDLCRYIILEEGNIINLWTRVNLKWQYSKYAVDGEDKDYDNETTGLMAYKRFYSYCGKEEVERMKRVLRPISIWESYEQLHWCNIDYIKTPIYDDIYVFDANSAFTYGAMQLQSDFDILKEYLYSLYKVKEKTIDKLERSKYKNLQNYLIGYFARVSGFIRVRSDIILNSNLNIKRRMVEITDKGGKVYLSNTDSIVTDVIGAEILDKYKGTDVGQFKLEGTHKRLIYKSPNAYQLDNDITYSGMGYFARKEIDLFKGESAKQEGNLIVEDKFMLDCSCDDYKRLCSIKLGEIVVTKTNAIGEVTKITRYRLV